MQVLASFHLSTGTFDMQVVILIEFPRGAFAISIKIISVLAISYSLG